MEKRYYYKDSKGNYYDFKNTVEDDSLIKITKKEFTEYQASLLKPVDPEVQAIYRQKIIRINELKELLQSTDYLAIKYSEGELTNDEYATTKAQRRAWRAEINSIEETL